MVEVEIVDDNSWLELELEMEWKQLTTTSTTTTLTLSSYIPTNNVVFI